MKQQDRDIQFVKRCFQPSQIFDNVDEVWYECPHCGRRFRWLDRTSKDKYCPRCGNYLSWAKLDFESYRQTDTSFDKDMTFQEFLQDPAYGHTWEHEIQMTISHPEKDILKGCISLMQLMVDEFEDYLDFMDIHPQNDEERFAVNISYFTIVQRLFLWNTRHSGGTSTMMKCGQLGIDDSGRCVEFLDERDAEEE